MAVLPDTDVLLRLAQPHHPHAQNAVRALRPLRVRNEALYIVQQNIVEFWAVATHPVSANGLEFTTEQAAAEIDALRRLFVLLLELPLMGGMDPKPQCVDLHQTGCPERNRTDR